MPNDIVIEAMIKGLRPGPTTQYFGKEASTNSGEASPKDG
jgi:hypothetical protein